MSPIHPAATRGLLGGWTGWPGRWLRAAWVARWCHPFLRFGGRYGLAVAAVALAGGLRWAFTAWAGPGLAFSTICYPAVMIAALLGGFGPGLLASALATLGAAGLGSPGERPGLLLFLGLGLFTSAVAEFYRRSRDRAAAGSRATAMAEHRELLATIVAHSPAAICVIRGSDLRIQLINSAYQAIAPGKPMLGRTMDEVWPEIQRPLAELFRRVLATGEPHLELNTPFTIARQEGAPVETAYFSWSLHRFRLPGENGWALLNTAWETTQQNLAENRLRELSQELSYHVDNSPLAVIEWGPDMRLTRWSGEAERIFGWTAGEVLGKRMEEFRWVYREDLDQVAEVSRELRTGTNSQRFSANRNYRKDGTVVHCEWYNSSLLDASGRLRSILSLVLDVTERERMEARLKEEAQHKDDFLALLGHELRNPLAPIGNAVHLLRQAGQDPDLAGRACAIIDRQVAHMARLVDDLLDVSRITRGLVQLQKQEIDLVVTVGSALGDYQPVLAASAQTLAASLPERPIWIQADRARIVQVV